MGRKEEIVEKVRKIAAPLAAGEGLELVDVELGGAGGRTTLRLYIDRDGGVSLDDCSSVSRAISAALDVEDPIEGAAHAASLEAVRRRGWRDSDGAARPR